MKNFNFSKAIKYLFEFSTATVRDNNEWKRLLTIMSNVISENYFKQLHFFDTFRFWLIHWNRYVHLCFYVFTEKIIKMRSGYHGRNKTVHLRAMILTSRSVSNKFWTDVTMCEKGPIFLHTISLITTFSCCNLELCNSANKHFSQWIFPYLWQWSSQNSTDRERM